MDMDIHIPSIKELNNMSQYQKTFESPASKKELRYQVIRDIVTLIQEATKEGQTEVTYRLPPHVYENTKLCKWIREYFIERDFTINSDNYRYYHSEWMTISWYKDYL